jgi:hypothetical protein
MRTFGNAAPKSGVGNERHRIDEAIVDRVIDAAQ